MLQEIGQYGERQALERDRLARPGQAHTFGIEFAVSKAVTHVCNPRSGVTASSSGKACAGTDGRNLYVAVCLHPGASIPAKREERKLKVSKKAGIGEQMVSQKSRVVSPMSLLLSGKDDRRHWRPGGTVAAISPK